LIIATLRHCVVSDISPLAGERNLRTLDIACNRITDISGLAGLTNLRYLNLDSNNITAGTTALGHLEDLFEVHISTCGLTDISFAEHLEHLYFLDVGGNQIIDIEPLVLNTDFGSGDHVNLTDNPLSEQSINEYIPALEARGAEVYY